MLEHADFESASSVFELGCGTGRLARRLLDERLPPTARYRGTDLSPVMVALARERIAPYADRAEIVQSDGGPPTAEPAGAHDRFVSAYVFDLLALEEMRAALREAHRMLRPAGRLCLTSLSTGVGPFSRLVSAGWSRLQAFRPGWVGGCRPIDLQPLVDPAAWRVLHHAKLVAFGVTSEVLVAERS